MLPFNSTYYYYIILYLFYILERSIVINILSKMYKIGKNCTTVLTMGVEQLFPKRPPVFITVEYNINLEPFPALQLSLVSSHSLSIVT